MAKEKKSKKTNNNGDTNQQNPETEERTRLKTLAYTNKIISETPAKPLSSLTPSKTIIKHHGKDIIKKSQRKSRYLFSFSGLLAPISGGKIGELTDLRSKNPILYLEFPKGVDDGMTTMRLIFGCQFEMSFFSIGRMKLFGTIVYPKNRYLTLQFSKGGRNVICEDCFDNMIVFSEGYWVGNKEENPDEARLDIPEELYEAKQSEFDFQGGAGATVMQNKTVRKAVPKSVTEESPSDSAPDDMETESPERQVNPKDIEYTTPVRHSERTAGKRFKFNEASSGDDSPDSISDTSAKSTDEAADILSIDQNLGISETAVMVHSSEVIQLSTVQMPPPSMLSSGEKKASRGGLVQATISTLFKKVEEKNTAEDAVKIDPTSKKIAQPSSSKSKDKSLTKKLVSEAAELPILENISQVRKEGTRTTRKKGKSEADEGEDDIEEISSSSEGRRPKAHHQHNPLPQIRYYHRHGDTTKTCHYLLHMTPTIAPASRQHPQTTIPGAIILQPKMANAQGVRGDFGSGGVFLWLESGGFERKRLSTAGV
ncbi:hypothetical protein KSS87_020985, partial [Heliosperma pusillum]